MLTAFLLNLRHRFVSPTANLANFFITDSQALIKIMGGGCHVDDQEFASALTLVLVGKTGNGKSATGNSILGTKSFQSRRSSSGVTIKSEWKTTKMQDGRVVNVIDTPGTNVNLVKYSCLIRKIF
ncbi:putative AIG1-type guanine nucleotide-binding (G) domain-containing protein [Helianthus annuus]|nr:putative AIG1-type guanine nucleotide-binding (G) domain-containing protein [Helianthus annuus]